MKTFYALFLFLITSAVSAQINFEPGYFIDNNGNKVEGFIRNIAWKNNPVEFEYTPALGGAVRIVKISEAKEFNVSSYKFTRHNVKIERSSGNTNKMDNYRELRWNNETLYLKVLVEGSRTLYQYEDSNLVKYFYSTGSGPAEQLIFKEYVVNGQIHNNSQYKQQLFNAMKDVFPTMPKFKPLQYKKENLVDLFTEYNMASGAGTTDYSSKHNQGSFSLKFTPGVSFASLEIGNALLRNSETEFDTRMAFRIGVELEYILPFNNNKWSLFIDPNYQMYKNEASQGNYNFKAEYNFIEIPMGVRHYMFLNDKSKIFIDAAYVLDFSMGESVIQLNAQEPMEISKTTNYALGVGFSYDRFSIEARHNFAHGILNEYQLWGTKFSTTNLILGYRFL